MRNSLPAALQGRAALAVLALALAASLSLSACAVADGPPPEGAARAVFIVA